MTTRWRQLPRRRASVELRDVDDGAVLIASSGSATYALNPTGRAIWELCDGTTTVEEVVEAICQIFDVPKETAFTELTAVLEQLAAAGLVEGAVGEK